MASENVSTQNYANFHYKQVIDGNKAVLVIF